LYLQETTRRFDGWTASLKVKSAAAPLFWSDVGDGFGEVPAVAAKVLRIVLALAIGVVSRFTQDEGSALASALAVAAGIFDPDLDYVRVVRLRVAFSNRETAIARLHLDAVIRDAKTNGEAKGL
jgi:hypothetical protein